MRTTLSYLLACWFSIAALSAQEIVIDSGFQILRPCSDELFPAWSPDASSILFQSDSLSFSDIFLYMVDADSVIQLTQNMGINRHPVWHPDGKHIVFERVQSGEVYLYKMHLRTRALSRLFGRDIQSRDASFQQDGRLVYFTGYDAVHERWHIYSYDFIYDNLNLLNADQDRCENPSVSPDGKQILYQQCLPQSAHASLVVSNWYGNVSFTYEAQDLRDPVWNPAGLKILFISPMDEEKGELYSIWTDETHLERLTFDRYEIRNPSVSPDGQKLVLSVNKQGDFDLVVIPFDL